MSDQWEKVSSKEIHKNPWYRLMQDDVIMPSGQMGKYTYIDRAPGAIIVALNNDNEIYLVGQYRYPVQAFSWEIPMGTKENNDADMMAAARRELLEEVGLEAGLIEEIGTFSFSNGVSNQQAHVFLARQLVQKEAKPDYTEFITMKRVALEEMEDLIRQQEITDGATLAAYYKLKLHLGL